MSAPDRPILPRDLAGTVAHAGIDPTLEGRALQDALRAAIATRRGYCWWDVDHAGWVVTLDRPERHEFYGRTLGEALAWCLVRLMAPELGIGPFRVWPLTGGGTWLGVPRHIDIPSLSRYPAHIYFISGDGDSTPSWPLASTAASHVA